MSPQQLIEVLNKLPLSNETKDKELADIVNLMFVGSNQELVRAFETAGWVEAQKLEVKSGFKSFIATVEDQGYKPAPFSQFFLDGRPADHQFQKQNNTFHKRHHARIYKLPAKYQGRDVWAACATHDIGIGFRRGGTQWTHLVDAAIDRERTKIKNDLMFTGLVRETLMIDRPSFTEQRKNTARDFFQTDGKALVVILQ